MARITPRPTPTTTQPLIPVVRQCPTCSKTRWTAYHHYRTRTPLDAVVRLTLPIRRCLTPACTQFRTPYRPQQEGRLALPKHAFGLDVIASIGTLRYAHHRSVTEMHHTLRARQLVMAPRPVTSLLERYDELLSLTLNAPQRLERLTHSQGWVL